MYDSEAYFVQLYGPREGIDWLNVQGQGKTDADGNPADVLLLVDNRSSLNNIMWKGGGKGIGSWVSAADTSSLTELQIYKNDYNKLVYENTLKGGEPEEVIKKMLYNAEEQEVYSEYYSILSDTVQQWRGDFISGAKDPNSDADWKAYLDALDAEGLKEILEIGQSCYTRMMG